MLNQVEEAYKVIASYKWVNGFKCHSMYKGRQCGNTKYFKGKYPYSRRCTKCKVEDTPTARTAFHKIRIPLNVALDVVRKILASDARVTSTAMSDQINQSGVHILQKTVWYFLINVYGRIPEPSIVYDQYAHFLIVSIRSSHFLYARGSANGVTKYLIKEVKPDPSLLTKFVKEHTKTGTIVNTYYVRDYFELDPVFLDIHRKHARIQDKKLRDQYIIMAQEFHRLLSGIRTRMSHNEYLSSYINFCMFKMNGGSFDELMEILCSPV